MILHADLAHAGGNATRRRLRAQAYAVVTATYELDAEGAHVSMATPAGLVEARLAVGGVHNVRNALAAAACALAVGIEPRSISAGPRDMHGEAAWARCARPPVRC